MNTDDKRRWKWSKSVFEKDSTLISNKNSWRYYIFVQNKFDLLRDKYSL